VLATEHVAEGTRVRLRAADALAHALEPYRLEDASLPRAGQTK
jgi:hypothetical protein